MLAIILVIAALMLLVSIVFFIIGGISLITIMKEFTQLRVAAVIMEKTFSENTEATNNMREFISRGIEGVEAQYSEIHGDHEKLSEFTRKLHERMNSLESNVKKPMDPDVRFN